jgi:putative transcriptional regulator
MVFKNLTPAECVSASPPLSRCSQIDVARATGISRNMLSKLYYDRAQRVDLVDVAKLCEYLNCSVGDLFETVR